MGRINIKEIVESGEEHLSLFVVYCLKRQGAMALS
jgi:hypothetical protein